MTLKSDLIQQAQKLGIETDKLTIAQLKAKIDEVSNADQTSTTDDDSTDIDNSQSAEEAFAKAGRRSRKQVKEAEAEALRQVRKQESPDLQTAKVKNVIKPPRPRNQRRAKKYKQSTEHIDANKYYDVDEALDLVIKTTVTKFDSSVDIAISLGVDPKKADQNIRDFIILPSGTGKNVAIAAYVDDDQVDVVLKAGASIVGKEVFLQQLDQKVIDFDILITMPHLMASLSKYAKLLGPKGLMPNPKAGTITKDIVKTINQIKAGRIEYKVDENGLIHMSIGKVSFGTNKLKDNLQTLITSLKSNKPNNFKGTYIQQIHLSTTMGPSIKMNIPQ